MKTSEFIKKVKELGFNVIVSPYSILIDKGGTLLAIVETVKEYKIETFNIFVEQKAKELFDICVEYARTPLSERKEEKKYYLRLKDAFYASAYRYLNFDIDERAYVLHNNLEHKYYKMKFTQKEIDDIKKQYNTDLEEFEQIKVEEN